jgi:hypothetical protein
MRGLRQQARSKGRCCSVRLKSKFEFPVAKTLQRPNRRAFVSHLCAVNCDIERLDTWATIRTRRAAASFIGAWSRGCWTK